MLSKTPQHFSDVHVFVSIAGVSALKVLIVDNYDSSTNNLVHYLKRIDPAIDVHVVYNDAHDFLFARSFHSFDAIVMAPGPGNVAEPDDIGIAIPILGTDKRPIFGVCLGHQAIAQFAGAQVVRAPEPIHGRICDIHHNGEGLFKGLRRPFHATCCHSWVVDRPLPDDLRLMAWAEGDAAVMGLEDKAVPRWGVQFHPEAIGTKSGMRIMRNFLDLARSAAKASTTRRCKRSYTLYWRQVGPALDTASIVDAARGLETEPILLESAMAQGGASRFSYVAVPTGLGDRTLAYWQDRKVTLVRDEHGRTTQHDCSIFDLLDEIEQSVEPDGTVPPPFEFRGGAIGWLGYELKSECNPRVTSSNLPDYPNSVFRISHSFLVVDHLEDATYVAACTTAATEAGCERSLATLTRIASHAGTAGARAVPRGSTSTLITLDARHSDRDYLLLIEKCRQKIKNGESYELCLANCLEARANIDPWAFYLTLRSRDPAPFAAYLPMGGVTVASSSPERFLKIDSRDPAPFAAYLPMGGVTVAEFFSGTFPEDRHGRSDCRQADQGRPFPEERPKGKIPKPSRASAQQRKEMCGKHDDCRPSATRPGYGVRGRFSPRHKVVRYRNLPATVHQVVSTIEGRLRTTVRSVDAIKACFPGGSITGAPKVRSMEILDRLENGPRGVYSGVLGWIGFDGQLDLSIVTRAAVFHNGTVTIGCGGAITHSSDPKSELSEIKRKARALSQALSQTPSVPT